MKNCKRCNGLLRFDAYLGAMVCCACARPLYLPIMPIGPWLQDEYLSGYSHAKHVPKHIPQQSNVEDEQEDEELDLW